MPNPVDGEDLNTAKNDLGNTFRNTFGGSFGNSFGNLFGTYTLLKREIQTLSKREGTSIPGSSIRCLPTNKQNNAQTKQPIQKTLDH